MKPLLCVALGLFPVLLHAEAARSKLLSGVQGKAPPLAEQCNFDPTVAWVKEMVQNAKASKGPKDLCVGMGTLACSVPPCEQLKRFGAAVQRKIHQEDASLEGYFKIYLCHSGPNAGKVPNRESDCPEVMANDDYHPFVLCVGKVGGTATKRPEAKCP